MMSDEEKTKKTAVAMPLRSLAQRLYVMLLSPSFCINHPIQCHIDRRRHHRCCYNSNTATIVKTTTTAADSSSSSTKFPSQNNGNVNFNFIIISSFYIISYGFFPFLFSPQK